MLRAAADLAAGVPSLTWDIVAQAGREGDVAARAVEGWQRIRRANATSVRQQWDELRRLHPAAQALVAAISLGIRPHGIPAASKTVDDGLNRLRDVGVAWQPEDRTGRSLTRYSPRSRESTRRHGLSGDAPEPDQGLTRSDGLVGGIGV